MIFIRHFFGNWYRSFGPLFTPKFHYRSISWEPMGRILYMQSYWQDLAWDCYTQFFQIFVLELCPLIYAKISFPLNILRTNWQISPNFIYAFILTRSTLGLLHKIFQIICTRVMYALILTRSSLWFLYVIFLEIGTGVLALYLRQNSITAQYLENQWVEFYICSHIDKI